MSDVVRQGAQAGDLVEGDLVELATVPPGREKRLRVGQRGEVVCTGLEWGWVTVQFDGRYNGRPYLLRPSHVTRVAHAPAAVPV